MPVKRRGQMLVAMVLLLGLLVMSLLVTSYQAHALFLRTRGVVARETVAAITADFNRALAAVLAAYSRVCHNATRFPDAAHNFHGLSCDTTLAERVAEDFLTTWSDAIKVAYAEYGIQVRWKRGVAETAHLLPHQPYFVGMLNLSWYRGKAGSYAFARLRVNLTTVGFYNWENEALVGITLSIEEFYNSDSGEKGGKPSGQTIDTIRVRVSVDNGTYYGLLLAKGWIEVYAYDNPTRSWSKVGLGDVTYEGLGYYSLRLKKDVSVGSRLRIVASDDRGIIVVAEETVRIKE